MFFEPYISDAHVYFAAMLIVMGLRSVVHAACWWVTRQNPHIMPDETERRWYRRAEASMAGECLAMLWYMWLVLPFMVSFCATQPLEGFMAHAPWIAYASVTLWAKMLHLRRLRARAVAPAV